MWTHEWVPPPCKHTGGLSAGHGLLQGALASTQGSRTPLTHRHRQHLLQSPRAAASSPGQTNALTTPNAPSVPPPPSWAPPSSMVLLAPILHLPHRTLKQRSDQVIPLQQLPTATSIRSRLPHLPTAAQAHVSQAHDPPSLSLHPPFLTPAASHCYPRAFAPGSLCALCPYCHVASSEALPEYLG